MRMGRIGWVSVVMIVISVAGLAAGARVAGRWEAPIRDQVGDGLSFINHAGTGLCFAVWWQMDGRTAGAGMVEVECTEEVLAVANRVPEGSG